MECQEFEPHLIDYLDGLLSPAIRTNVEKHLGTCENCRHTLEEYKTLFHDMQSAPLEKPGAALREKFDIMLQSELNIDATARIIGEEKKAELAPVRKANIFLRVAASLVLLATGAFIGTMITSKKVTAPEQNTGELAALKNEVKEMKETILFNQLNDESASERIKAVAYAEQMGGSSNQKIIDAMFHTLNNDKNLNVRLAALYSVAKFSGSRAVSDSLLASLPRQKEPILQIVLINILAERKDSRAADPIRKILSDKKTMQPVRDIAQKGLREL